MHIKKLEIAGFKSFVDRSVIHFDHDIIGIVGPNGCGKSNIVDAIRWCMGEQSAKHLRGRAMEDVIFNGSESRGPHGFAEVTLTFDNSNPTEAADLPDEYRDYPEIAVTRRLFRDGTSEYLLNRTQVRLRDITELFLGTGVGTKAYSIVEQGRIGQIVSARPEDRRIFLEEAAGITKYKQRRRQAERKMELTRQNLLRLTDIVSEIERTRTSLKRQVAKAERFLRYREELEDLQLHEASHKLLELIVVERVEREATTTANESSRGLRGQLNQAEEHLTGARNEAVAIEKRADDASRRAFEADNEVSSLTAEIERSRDRLAHLSERMGSDEKEQDEIAARVAQSRAEQDDLSRRITELGNDEQARQADAAAEDEALAALRQEESRADAEVSELRQQAAEGNTGAAAAEARIDGLAQRIAETRTRRDRSASEREELDGELEELTARQHALERSVAELAEGKRLTEAEREELERELEQLRARLLDVERAHDAAKNELGLRRNRLRALEDLHRRLEGVGAGVRALLSKGDASVLGLVADRIEAPEELTAAFAGLLGERLQYVVISDPEHGLELLDELRDTERGRANLIAARPRYVAGRLHFAQQDARVIERLADRLWYAPEDEALVRALVGDALLVHSARDAYELVKSRPGVTAVALDGTVVRPDGTVGGGSGDDVAAAMVEQKREMRALAQQVEQLAAEESRVADEHHKLRARMTEVGTALDRARQGAHEGELAHVTAEKDLARTKSEIERAKSRQQTLERDLADVETALEALVLQDTESRAQLDTLRTGLEHVNHALAKAEARAASWKERVAGQAALVTERRVRLAQVREQTEAARAAAERLKASILELEQRSERLGHDILESAAQFGEAAARMMLAREKRQLTTTQAKTAHTELDEARRLLEQVRHALATREAELKALRDQLDAADEQARKHEMALQRIELERSHLLSSVRDKFRGLELPRVVGDYHSRPPPDAEHHRRIEDLSQLLDRMGPVNLDAKTEYEDAEQRFVQLSEQKTDVEKALEELDRAIKHMNRESRRRFKETYESVNALFKKTFTRMFRGGRAELVLNNPEDMLTTGVEIIAQPPGKRLGNIELMSGGEKALTATSLIFAIFQHKPSPFCLLDEVDAPLDEANVSRYNEAIRGMTHMSQFILITHIKKTMQSVDVLYGVTMGEPGVSRIVSVKVNDAATARSDRTSNAIEAPAAESEEAAGSTQVA